MFSLLQDPSIYSSRCSVSCRIPQFVLHDVQSLAGSLNLFFAMFSLLQDPSIYSSRCSVSCRIPQFVLCDVQSLAGSLNFACSAIAPVRTFLRRLINFAIGKTNQNNWIRLNHEDRRDTCTSLEFQESFSGNMWFLPDQWTSSDVVHLTTDARDVAFGAVFGDKYLQDCFPTDCLTVYFSERGATHRFSSTLLGSTSAVPFCYRTTRQW